MPLKVSDSPSGGETPRVSLPDGAVGLRVDNVSVVIGRRGLLHDISMSAGPGEIVGILGRSGAGKTTLIRTVLGDLGPVAGSVRIGGEDPVARGAKGLREFGLMLERPSLYRRLTCTENLALAARLVGPRAMPVAQALEAVGLGRDGDQRVATLSRGMTQRLVLARAILGSPTYLILDEPTANLDPSSAAGIRALMRAEAARGAVVLLATHNMSEAAELCDRVLFLRDGRTVGYDRPDSLIRNASTSLRLDVELLGGERITIDGTSGPELERFNALLRGGRVQTVHSLEPSLEDLFHSLADGES